jgi:organic radical activating enzyme
MVEGHLSEIFHGIQGEGPYVGRPQVFLRFAGCHLRCRYCDTPGSWERTPEVLLRLEGEHDGVSVERCPNPVSVSWIRQAVRRVGREGTRQVSITGGEPLLQAAFLQRLLPLLRGDGWKIYLETDGTLPDCFRRIASSVDVVAMDLKFPSATREPPFWESHEAFLRVGLEAGAEMVVKLVLTADASDEEWERGRRILSVARGKAEVVLQPVTPLQADWIPPSFDQLARWRGMLEEEGHSVMVLPQTQHLLIA